MSFSKSLPLIKFSIAIWYKVNVNQSPLNIVFNQCENSHRNLPFLANLLTAKYKNISEISIIIKNVIKGDFESGAAEKQLI